MRPPNLLKKQLLEENHYKHKGSSFDGLWCAASAGSPATKVLHSFII